MEHDETGSAFMPSGLQRIPSYAPTVSTHSRAFSTGHIVQTEECEIISQATAQAISAARSIILTGGTQSTALNTARAAAKSVLVPKKGSVGTTLIGSSRKGFFGRKKGKQQAEIIASMALVSVNSSLTQQNGGLTPHVFNHGEAYFVPQAHSHSMHSGISIDDESIFRHSPMTAGGSQFMNDVAIEEVGSGRYGAIIPNQLPANRRVPSSQARTRNKLSAYSPTPNSLRQPYPALVKQEAVSVNAKRGSLLSTATDDFASLPQDSKHGSHQNPSPASVPALEHPVPRAPSPPRERTSSPAMPILFLTQGLMPKKNAIVGAAVGKTLDGDVLNGNADNSTSERKTQDLSEESSPPSCISVSRIPSKMPDNKTQHRKSKPGGRNKPKDQNYSPKSSKHTNGYSGSYSTSYSGTDESESEHSHSIEAGETISHESSEEETVSSGGDDTETDTKSGTQDRSDTEKPRAFFGSGVEPFFASIAAAFTCSPAKEARTLPFNDETTDDGDGHYGKAFFSDDRNDKDVRQMDTNNQGSMSSILQNLEGDDQEAAREEAASDETRNVQNKEEKPVSMEQLVLRALAATVPGSQRPKLDLEKPPLRPKSVSRNIKASPSKLTSGHAIVRQMSRDRETGLFSPPSVDCAPLPVVASMKARREEDSSDFKSGSDETDGADGPKDGKKSHKKSGWLRRKGFKNAMGSF